MTPRILLLTAVLLGITFAGSKSFGAEESRGWGSTWTTPRNEQERIGRDLATRLEKALRANDWAAVDKTLADAQRAGFKSESLQIARVLATLARQNYSEAVNLCNQALAPLHREHGEVASDLLTLRAEARFLAGQDGMARVDLERAIAADKTNLQAQNDYAWLLATCPEATVRDGKRALQCARAAHAHDMKSAVILDTLAAAEAEVGDFAAAVKDEKRAIALAKGDTNCERHLESYLKRTPLRESIEARRAAFDLHLAAKR